MRTLLLILLMLPFSIHGKKPDFEWAIKFETNAKNDNPLLINEPLIKTDQLGNVYLMGGFRGTIDADPGAGTFNLTALGFGQTDLDIFLIKISPAGNLIWAKSIGGQFLAKGMDFDISNTGELYVTGYFVGTVDFDPGPGEVKRTSKGDDIFILSLDSQGNFRWVNKIGGDDQDRGFWIAAGKYGIYTFSIFTGTVDFDPGPNVLNRSPIGPDDRAICAFDFNGNLIFAKEFGNAEFLMNGSDFNSRNYMSISERDEIYISGTCNTYRMDLYPGQGVYSNLCSFFGVFNLKLDSAGNYAWTKFGVGRGHGDPFTFGQNSLKNGRFAYYGKFYSEVDFDPNPGFFLLTPTPHPIFQYSVDSYYCIMDRDGNLENAVQLGEYKILNINDIEEDVQGNKYLAGSFTESCDFSPGPIDSVLTADSIDGFICQYGPNGALNWSLQIGGARDDRAISLELGPNGTVYTTGIFRGAVNFDKGNSNFTLNGNTQNGSFYITKHSGTISRIDQSEASSLRIYPNPTSGRFHIDFGDLSSPQNMSIYSSKGVHLETRWIDPLKNEETELNHPPGVYFVFLTDGKNTQQFKLIRE